MLPVLVSVNPSPILSLLPRLATAAEEPWWEVSVGVGRVCLSLLSLSPFPSPTGEEGEGEGGEGEGKGQADVCELLASTLLTATPLATRHLLGEMAPTLPSLPLAAKQAFARALLSLPSADRTSLVGGGWPALAVAEGVMAVAKEEGVDHLLTSHAELLMVLLSGRGVGGVESSPPSAWQAWLRENKDYLYVGLCDEDLCHQIAPALLSLFSHMREHALPTFSTLFSSLRMLCAPEGHPTCQASARIITITYNLLASLFKMGGPFETAIATMVSEFEPTMRSAMSSTVQLVASYG
ncbi:MAG: hypothetical protein SGPRY_011114 [Prymnesium sp.]